MAAQLKGDPHQSPAVEIDKASLGVIGAIGRRMDGKMTDKNHDGVAGSEFFDTSPRFQIDFACKSESAVQESLLSLKGGHYERSRDWLI